MGRVARARRQLTGWQSRAGGTRGQSGTVAVVVLVAVVLAAVALAGAFVLDFSGNSGDEPVITDVDSSLEAGELTVRHGGGDTLDPTEVSVVAGATSGRTHRLASLAGIGPDQQFTAGDAATLDLSAGSLPPGGELRVVVVHEPTNSVLHEEGYAGLDTPEFDLVDARIPDTVGAGETLGVDYTVENSGSRDGATTVTLGHDGATVDTDPLSLAAGENASGTLSYDVTAAAGPAMTVTLDTGDDSASETVTVTTTPADPQPSTVYVGSREGTLYAVNATTGGEEWAFTDPGGPVDSSPTVYRGTVYVGSDDGRLYAVDAATGTAVWTFADPGRIRSSPTVVEGTVYVGSRDSTLYAVDAETGNEEWRFDAPSGAVFSSPTVVDGTVYVGSDDGRLYAVDAATGTEVWRFADPAGLVQSSPTVANDTVYVGSNDGGLYAVDTATGAREWAFTDPTGPVRASPVVSEGVVYVGSNDGRLYAVDATTGTEVWRFAGPGELVVSSPTVYRGTVYVGSTDGRLYAVNASTGTEAWSFADPVAAVESSPTAANGTVYVGSGGPFSGGRLHAVNASTGTEMWSFDSGQIAFAAPTAVADPENGSGIGSRSRQRTLGHHDR